MFESHFHVKGIEGKVCLRQKLKADRVKDTEQKEHWPGEMVLFKKFAFSS